MLPKEKRVRNSREFKRIYQKGSFFSVDMATVHFLPNRMPFSRVGIVVNKKVEAMATKRNKLKRQFREVSKKFYNDIPPGYDVIVTIKKAASGVNFLEIEKTLKESLKKVGQR